jgi:enamine deaminase RidA (YjgF/YER057c/UK114 family)
MAKQCIHPDFLFESVNRWGFSQIITTEGGKTVWLSGQTPWDANEKPHGTTRRAQMKTCVGNIKRAVEAAGGTLDDVVSLRLYMPGYDPSEWQEVAAGLKENFPGPNPPTTTWIGITSLASADYLIEIEAFAVINK